MNRERGTVKWFSREKGWGFLRRENGDEIFVHHSDIEGEGHVSLVDDEEVEFGVEDMEKGPRAREVRRAGQAARSAETPSPKSSARESGGGSRARGRRSPATDRKAPHRDRGPEVTARQREPEPTAEPSATTAPDDGSPPPLDRGLRERLRDRFPIFRDR